MPEYLAPGVYMEEVDRGPKTIEGVSTSTAGMVGVTRRGSTDGLPILVTSFADFRRKFGGYFDFGSAFSGHQYLPYAVEGFFQNGGKRVYIKRVKGNGAVASNKTTQGGLITRLKSDASSRTHTVKLSTMRAIDIKTKLTFTQIKDGVLISSGATPLSITSYNRETNEVTLVDPLQENFEAKYTIVESSHNRNASFDIFAKNEGSWGDEIDIRVYHESMAKSTYVSLPGGTGKDIKLKTTAGFYVNAWVEIDNGENKFFRKIIKVDGSVITFGGAKLTAKDINPQGGTKETWVSTCEFGLSVSYENITEDFSGLTLENVPGHYYEDIINSNSELIRVANPPTDTEPLFYPSGDDGLHIKLGGGNDGSAPVIDDYKGVDNGPGDRTGFQALGDIDQVSIVAVPGITDTLVQNAMINQCEIMMDRFAILDPPANESLSGIQDHRSNYDSKYAAIYYPWIKIRNPLTGKDIDIPPSGHIAGIYARSDIERGVHKAPANEVIRGITGLEKIVNKREQDILNPKPNHINVLRDFRGRGRGYRVWGARCITSDPDWKYINVRRLFIFVEESIEEGTQWVVFEPNDEPTWARVRRTVTNFLYNIWRDGALQGKIPEEAFFVRCDRTTMTQTDIDNGKLIMEIGIAPVKPAEFVIFRIGQWAGGSEVEE